MALELRQTTKTINLLSMVDASSYELDQQTMWDLQDYLQQWISL